MDAPNQTPTRGQLQRTLSQRLQTLYREQLGHQPEQITCQIFDEKIVIVLDGSISKPEQLLAENGQNDLVKQVREDLEIALRPKVQALIEDVVGVPVLDLLSDSTLETGRQGIIAILKAPPPVR